jgi:hypothetical protein
MLVRQTFLFPHAPLLRSRYAKPDALPFGRLWYGEPDAISNAIDYARFRSRSHDSVIRVYDAAGNVIETHEHKAISKSGEAAAHLPLSAPSLSLLSLWREST